MGKQDQMEQDGENPDFDGILGGAEGGALE